MERAATVLEDIGSAKDIAANEELGNPWFTSDIIEGVDTIGAYRLVYCGR